MKLYSVKIRNGSCFKTTKKSTYDKYKARSTNKLNDISVKILKQKVNK